MAADGVPKASFPLVATRAALFRSAGALRFIYFIQLMLRELAMHLCASPSSAVLCLRIQLVQWTAQGLLCEQPAGTEASGCVYGTCQHVIIVVCVSVCNLRRFEVESVGCSTLMKCPNAPQAVGGADRLRIPSPGFCHSTFMRIIRIPADGGAFRSGRSLFVCLLDSVCGPWFNMFAGV